MELFFVDYLDRLETLHNDYVNYLDNLSTDELDWVPGHEMNSLCVITVHVTEAERYWLGMGVGDEIPRNRQAEFMAKGYEADDLLMRFEENFQYAERALSNFSVSQFGEFREVRLNPNNIWKCTAGWALLHALDHTAEHLGHVGITRQLVDRR